MVAINQLLGRRRCCRENAKPCKWKKSLVHGEGVGNTWAADPMKTVATCNKIAMNLARFAVVVKSNFRVWGIEVVHTRTVDLKQNLAALFASRRNQIFHNLLLGIDRD